MLIIHPFDSTTDFLQNVYLHLEGIEIIRGNVGKGKIRAAIRRHEKIVFLGHGCEKGLFGYGRLFVDSSFVQFLREKECVYIWCNANVFVEKYGLSGFYTGMIISEVDEAIMCCVPFENGAEIRESNKAFALAIKLGIERSADEMCRIFFDNYLHKSYVGDFNRTNIFIK